MGYYKTMNPMIVTTVRVSPEFHRLCREHFISFTEAMRIGISLMLAEKGVTEYDNKLNIIRKMNLLRAKLEETSKELEKMKEKGAGHGAEE